MISGWVRKVTEHCRIIKYHYLFGRLYFSCADSDVNYVYIFEQPKL